MTHYYPVVIGSKSSLQKDKIIVWMNPADYDSGLKLTEHAYIDNPLVETFEFGLSPDGYHHKSRVVWAADNHHGEMWNDGLTLFRQCTEYSLIRPIRKSTQPYRFLVNHSKKLYVDKVANPTGSRLHPLPFLTVEIGTTLLNRSPLIGSWNRDIISVEMIRPTGYDEVIFDL